jgi:hypothetical protein
LKNYELPSEEEIMTEHTMIGAMIDTLEEKHFHSYLLNLLSEYFRNFAIEIFYPRRIYEHCNISIFFHII